MRRILAALIIIVLAVTLLATCGKPKNHLVWVPPSPPPSDKEQYLNIAIEQEPKSIDPSKAADLYSSAIITEVMEGLTRIEQDEKGNIVREAGAKDWDMKDNGAIWVFHLRDYSWSDGQKVTAQQFEYGIKRTLDPSTGSQRAFLLYPIKGAEEYNTKKGKAEQVGVKALDDKTLEFTLNGPTPYFLELTYLSVMLPQRADMVEKYGDEYGTETGTILFNGPFVIKDWVHGSQIILGKNKNYYVNGQAKLDTVNYRIISDEETRMRELFAGNIDLSTVSNPVWLKKFVEAGKWTNFKGSELSTLLQFFNQKTKFFSNIKVREAFQTALDREDISKTIYKGIATPAYGLCPPSLQIGGYDFRTRAIHEPLMDVKAKVKDPKEYLMEGLIELGMDPDPSKVTIQYLSLGTDEATKEITEYIQYQYNKVLGVSMKIEYMEWPDFQKRVNKGDYEFAGMTWVSQYNDPINEFKVWWSGANMISTFWSNKTYDDLIKKSSGTNTQDIRFRAFIEAERILIYEDAVISPVVYRQRNTIVANYVKGIYSPSFGSGIELKYAYTYGRL